MAKLSTDELLEAFKEMTLIELSEFVKQFEDTFGVTAAAPVAAAAPAAAGVAGRRSIAHASAAGAHASASRCIRVKHARLLPVPAGPLSNTSAERVRISSSAAPRGS